MSSVVRNFSIIAHIDHGKSTLADRLLSVTGTVRESGQILDQMDLERERGVTIKLKPVRMEYKGMQLNLIDTPGHVDFSYEVSRSLAAVEGVLLLVDATQGIQAQTLAHASVAQSLGLTIIPVVNKIDLPSADVEGSVAELAALAQVDPGKVLRVSAKSGAGVPELLDAIVERIPPPKGDASKPLSALVFDAIFDEYRGVVAFVRLINGSAAPGQRMRLLGTKAVSEILEVGCMVPQEQKLKVLSAGEIGYIVTGLKNLALCRVGDTMTLEGSSVEPLPGYKEPQSMVFASVYPEEGKDPNMLRTALEKLRLNDSSLQFEGERSPTFGPGFRCGFLGLFHLEILQERLRREYGQSPIVTIPSVAYMVTTTQGEQHIIRNAMEFPDPSAIREVQEPWVRVHCVVPEQYLGAMYQSIHERRGMVVASEALESHASAYGARITITSEIPLAAVLTNFFDTVKSRTSGYASMYYEFIGYRAADIVKLDIIIAGERADALSSLQFRGDAESTGRAMLTALKDSLPREQFEIRLQAAVGSKILASERIAPLRKDVIAGLYGGDVTRKRKLLEKQKKGKKRMRSHGRVALPPSAYLAVLKKGSHGV